MRNEAHLTTQGFQDPTFKLPAVSSGKSEGTLSLHEVIIQSNKRGGAERKSEGERLIFSVCPGPSNDFL